MSIKILGGKARGFVVAVSDSPDLRPTAVLLRRKLFDWRQQWENYSFVDLCAGSGAMGLEALSRGADQVVFIEQNNHRSKLVEASAKKMLEKYPEIEGNFECFANGFEVYLKRFLKNNSHLNQVLFFDPPYENHQTYHDFVNAMKEVKFSGEIWIESDRIKGLKLEDLKKSFSQIIKEVEQGSHFILVGKI